MKCVGVEADALVTMMKVFVCVQMTRFLQVISHKKTNQYQFSSNSGRKKPRSKYKVQTHPHTKHDNFPSPHTWPLILVRGGDVEVEESSLNFDSYDWFGG